MCDFMLKKSTLYLLAVMLLALALSSLPSLFASVYAHQFERHERHWDSGKAVSDDAWLASQSSLKTALSLEPYHPEYLQLMSRLHSWKAWAGVDVPTNNEQWLLESLAIRPYWANGWSSFAYEKSIKGQVDEEFWQAYLNALASGMWEREVFYNLLNAGLNSWSQLSFEQRRSVVALFQRVATFDKKMARRALKIAESYNMKLPLCYSLRRLEGVTLLDRACSIKRA